MAPAHQGLQADDAAIGQVQPRLVVQLQFVATQRPTQLAFQVGQAARIAVDAFIEYVEGAALATFGLAHGDVRMPHQRVRAALGAGVGQAQAAAKQQAFAVDPVGFGQRLDDTLGDPFGAVGIAARVDQQGKFIAAQARQLVAGLQLLLEARDHLQYQTVAALMAKGVVDMAEVVQVQVAEGHAAAFVLRQARGQQGLETLAVGDAGQRVLLGQALQRRHQHTALAHMAQRAAQGIDVQLVTYQPVADTRWRCVWFVVEQQDGRQFAAPGCGLQRRRGQHHRLAVCAEKGIDCRPVRRSQQYCASVQRQQAFA